MKKAKPARKKHEGLVKRLSDAISHEYHFARDEGGRVYIYQNGVYVPGEFDIRRLVKRKLEDRHKTDEWSLYLGQAVIEYIRLGAPGLLVDLSHNVVNVKNGLLDLGTGELRPHSPDHLSPIQLPINYDPTATCPSIDDFIAQVFPEDAIDLAWEILGDALTPDRSIQKAILLIGEGGNGKSVFLGLYVNFVGPRNVSTLSLHKLEADRFAVARLYAKLSNVAADLPSEHLAGTSVFKSIVGGDLITGEHKFRDSFDFKPHVRLVFSANHPPQSKDASRAFYDRWVVVPFTKTFRGTDREISRAILDARLSDPKELSGALNKALPALRRMRERGRFSEGASTRAALQEFREVTDPLAVWLDRQTVSHPNSFVSKDELFLSYNEACEREGRPPMTRQAFGRALGRLRPEVQERQRTIRGRRQWIHLGIGFRAPVELQSESLDALVARDTRDLPNLVPPTNHAEVPPITVEKDKGIRVKRVQRVRSSGAAGSSREEAA